MTMIIDLDNNKRLGDVGDWDSPYSWPVRREFSRILHRPRPHVGIVYTERFLNSRPLTYFDDETKLIRAKASALLRQVHTPLPKPSKLLRPYETLDSYTSHQLIPYGVPQHVYHQSYFSEPAHLTIGRGHLACIQFAGGKGYPRRKHLYSDENRNIRDEIKFRSYYNRPKNQQDSNTLATGFAWRLLQLPPKDNKPFKLYKHSRTLSKLDSSKSDGEKIESEVEERPSYRKYGKTLTEPVKRVSSIDSEKIVETTGTDNKVSDYSHAEEKQLLPQTPVDENIITDSSVDRKHEEPKVLIEEERPRKSSTKLEKRKKLNEEKEKPIASSENDTPSEILDETVPPRKSIVDEEDVNRSIQEQLTTTNNVTEEKPSDEVADVTSDEKVSEIVPEEILPIEPEIPIVEAVNNELEKEKSDTTEVPEPEEPAFNNPQDNIDEDLESKLQDEVSAGLKTSEILTDPQVTEEPVETLDNQEESTNKPEIQENPEESEEKQINETAESDRGDDHLELTIADDNQREETVSDNVNTQLEDGTPESNDEYHHKLEETVHSEESKITVEFNDTEDPDRSDPTEIKTSNLADESGLSLNRNDHEMSESNITEINEVSDSFNSRQETVIQMSQTSTVEYTETYEQTDKSESFKDIVNEVEIKSDEENLE